jgi:hypothetical protein
MIGHIEAVNRARPKVIEDLMPLVASVVLFGHDGASGVAGTIATITTDDRSLFAPHVEVIPPNTNPRTGDYECLVKEFHEGSTPRARGLRASIKFTGNSVEDEAIQAKKCVEAVRDWSKSSKIGGDIVTVILERGRKVRWYDPPPFITPQSGR